MKKYSSQNSNNNGGKRVESCREDRASFWNTPSLNKEGSTWPNYSLRTYWNTIRIYQNIPFNSKFKRWAIYLPRRDKKSLQYLNVFSILQNCFALPIEQRWLTVSWKRNTPMLRKISCRDRLLMLVPGS